MPIAKEFLAKKWLAVRVGTIEAADKSEQGRDYKEKECAGYKTTTTKKNINEIIRRH